MKKLLRCISVLLVVSIILLEFSTLFIQFNVAKKKTTIICVYFFFFKYKIGFMKDSPHTTTT